MLQYLMYRVFVVDDEQEIRKGLVNFFPWNMLGYEVAGQAENGKQAFDFIMKNPDRVDVLFTDIKMPVMSGIELVRQLIQAGIHLKVVLLSAYSDFEYARDGLKMGVVDYILKPTEYNNLIQTFQRLARLLDEERGKSPVVFEDNDNDESALSYHGKLVRSAKQYVKFNYANTSLELTAEHIHLSPSYLSTIFREEAGITFSDYLISQKMENAARMMQDISYKTYEISEQVGYRSSKNFSRTFKKYFGVTPREYRDNHHRVEKNDDHDN
ncbi:DNA-binding response regulator [Spirochaetia bacterium]|nr:DNA-binding response regulator [Spirochaetia bacterium]